MISELRLRNFKCFESLDLALRKLTLLSGVNSSGKSTIIQSLLLLHQSHSSGALGAGRLALNSDLVSLGTASSILFEGSLDAVLDFAVAWSGAPPTEAAFRFRLENDASRAQFVGENLPAQELYSGRTPFRACSYVAAERTGPRAAFSQPSSGTLDPRGEYLAHFLAVEGNRQLTGPRVLAEAASPRLRHQTEAWLGGFSHGAAIHPRSHEELGVVGLSFSFPGPAGRTAEQRSTHVGFGLTYVLPVIVALLSALPGDLVLVENPEAHLHPKAQRYLAKLLAAAAASDVQVVVETHSDHILNGARLAVAQRLVDQEDVLVYHFPGRGEHGVGAVSPLAITIDRRGAMSEWPEGFFDQWEDALRQLLEPDRD